MPFWSVDWGKDAICAITHTRLRPGKDVNGNPYVCKLGCGHRFYRSALLEWIRYQMKRRVDRTCPLCRKTVKLADLYVPRNMPVTKKKPVPLDPTLRE